VNVVYHVEVEVDVPWGFDPTIKMPITMGTVPFRPVYLQQEFPAAVVNVQPPPMMGGEFFFVIIILRCSGFDFSSLIKK